VTRAEMLLLAITVVGHSPGPELFVQRAGAQPGDTLVLTGEIGGAGAGLLLLERPDLGASLPPQFAGALRRRQLEPQPRLAAGRALAEAGATAMNDLSDGLGGDAAHLAERSGVGLRIDATALPIAAGVAEIAAAAERDAIALAASSGEDYELLATLPADKVSEATRRLREVSDLRLTRVGEVLAGSGVEIRLPGGRLVEPAGFDQLA